MKWKEQILRIFYLRKTEGIKYVILTIKNRVVSSKRRKYIEKYLYHMLKRKKHIFVIQIGAHVGMTSNDPLYEFFIKNYGRSKRDNIQCSAVLVEPVKYLFDQLVKNYSACSGIFFENVAIAEKKEKRIFYSLKKDVDLEKEGMPFWLNQLGSLLSERISTLWDKYEKDSKLKQFLKNNSIKEKIQCITLTDLLKKYNITEIDLLQIDTEGYDFNIINSIDFGYTKPKAINYERVLLQENESRCRKLLMKNGYKLYDHGQDTLAILDD